jgi:Protein of unknown function (DUF1350)
MDWQEVAGNWLLIPSRPKAMIHFLGGAFVAAAPQVTYGWLLENLYRQGYGIIATPFINTFDHKTIAQEVHVTLEQGLTVLRKRGVVSAELPMYGLGHSMGCKVHLLLGSLYDLKRAGNILISFNNYPARKSIPLLEQFMQFAPDLNIEFTPTPEETLDLIDRNYQINRNLLIKFRNDTIDQTRPLSDVLINRFPRLTSVQILQGTHTTPIAQDVQWQPGEAFSPFDALGQFVKQEFYRDLNRLNRVILGWMEEW